MKKVFLSIAIAAIAFSANAQDSKSDQPLKFSVGVEAGLPLGDFKEFSKFGIGGSVQGEYAAAEKVGLTLNAGFLSFSGKTIDGDKFPSTSIVPVLAGAKYYFTDKVYGHAQVGISFMSVKFEGVTASASGFTYAPTIGVMPSENIDVSLKYLGISKDGTTSFLGLRVAYTF
jgi:hypothetical protein